MVNRMPGVMRCAAALAVGVAVVAVSQAPPAAAQRGNGLYEPFPEAAARESAKRFVRELPNAPTARRARLGDRQLARGVFVRPGEVGLFGTTPLSPPPAPRPASVRAGTEGRSPATIGTSLGLLLVLAAAAGGPLLAAARRRERAASA
jgi:hypothetical protein